MFFLVKCVQENEVHRFRGFVLPVRTLLYAPNDTYKTVLQSGKGSQQSPQGTRGLGWKQLFCKALARSISGQLTLQPLDLAKP